MDLTSVLCQYSAEFVLAEAIAPHNNQKQSIGVQWRMNVLSPI